MTEEGKKEIVQYHDELGPGQWNATAKWLVDGSGVHDDHLNQLLVRNLYGDTEVAKCLAPIAEGNHEYQLTAIVDLVGPEQLEQHQQPNPLIKVFPFVPGTQFSFSFHQLVDGLVVKKIDPQSASGLVRLL